MLGRLRQITIDVGPMTWGEGRVSRRAMSLIVLAWALLIGFALLFIAGNSSALNDFQAYYFGAERLLRVEPLYAGLDGGQPYLYPPLLAQSLMPFSALLGYDGTAVAWFILNLALLLSVLAAFSPFVPVSRRALFWALPPLFIPVLKSLYVGQVTIIIMALLAYAYLAVRRDQRFLAGCLLALAAWLKVYPALLVAYFLFKGDWRVMRGVIVAGLALAGLQIAISGPVTFFEGFRTLAELVALGQPSGAFKNSAITGFATRLFLQNPSYDVLWVNESLYVFTRYALMGVVGAGALVALARPRAAREYIFDLEYGLVIVASLLLSSTLWISGMPPLLLVYILLYIRPSDRWPRRWMWAAFGLTSIYHLLLLGYSPRHPLVLSIGFYGVFALWGLLIWLRIRSEVADERAGLPKTADTA